MQQLGNTAGKIASAAGAAGSATPLIASALVSAKLVTSATASAVVPVVGPVLGAIALIGGWIAAGRKKKKQADAQRAQVEISNNLLKAQSFELDLQLSQASGRQNQILAELQRLGLAQGVGLGGNFLKRTFTPGRVAEKELKSAVQQNEALSKEVEQKIGQLQTIQNSLQQLYNSLVKVSENKKVQDYVLYGLVTVGVGTAAYFAWQAFKPQKTK
jgi:hypothetical protein